MLFPDLLYREVAARPASLCRCLGRFVDAWRFCRKPDFEGQIRQLRPTTACISPDPAREARALCRAITRCSLAAPPRRLRRQPNRQRLTPMRCRGQPARPRGPDRILPLAASPVGTDHCSAASRLRPAVDALAARTLVKGEAPCRRLAARR
jgi:hypothetical protein